jgi:hypothetical protein
LTRKEKYGGKYKTPMFSYVKQNLLNRNWQRKIRNEENFSSPKSNTQIIAGKASGN